jgi:hypothetical protein
VIHPEERYRCREWTNKEERRKEATGDHSHEGTPISGFFLGMYIDVLPF